jgi:RNA polymerase sigma factor (sigma-70 family)
MEDNSNKNFGLSRADFDEMREKLKAGDESLFERVFVKHFNDCRRYLISQCNASPDDAYDVTVETLIRFRQALMEDKIGYDNLRFLFTQMAKQIYLKWLQHGKRLPTTTLDNQADDRAEDSDLLFDDETITLLEQAWQNLGTECKKLLKSHYYDGIQLKQISASIGQSDVAVRKRKERCMETLKKYFFELYQQLQ